MTAEQDEDQLLQESPIATGTDEEPVEEAVEGPEAEDDLVIARGLDFGARDHRVFAGLSFSLPARQLSVILGGDGSGKSLLLLGLIGRSPELGGTLQVAGLDAIGQPRRLQKISTAARIGKYIDLEPRHLVTQALLDRGAYEGLRRTDADRSYRRAAEILELKVAGDELVEDLSRYQQSLFAVALACLRENTLLVLDDADRGLNIGDQVRLYQALDALIDATGTTVVVSSVEPASIPADAPAVELPAAGTTKMHSR